MSHPAKNPTQPQPDPYLILLGQILDVQREIRDELRILNERRRGRNLTHAEHLVLGRLLPGILGQYGPGVSFLTRELLENPVYRALTNMSARQLGDLFRRAQNVDIAGLTIQRVNYRQHGAQFWIVEASR